LHEIKKKGIDSNLLLLDRDPPGSFFLVAVLAIVRLESFHSGLYGTSNLPLLRIATLIHIAELIVFAKRSFLIHNGSFGSFLNSFGKSQEREQSIVLIVVAALNIGFLLVWQNNTLDV
jgi:hypothetical protein